MEKVILRDFANLSCIEMIHFCHQERLEVTVVDDFQEEIVTDTLLLGMTWFGLIMHRGFNDEPYRIDEVIDLSGRDGYPTFINDKLLCRPLTTFIGQVFLKYNTPEFYDLIKQYSFVHQNMLHNYLSIVGEPGVVSARSVDVNFVYRHPRIQSIKKRRLAREITTEEAKAEFNRVLLTEPDFDKAAFPMFYRTGAIDKVQSYQLIVERSTVFDLNDNVLPFNIDASYCEGITDPADSLGESKAGGIAIVNNNKTLKDSEWLHAKVHYLCHVVHDIRFGHDCGTTKGAIVQVISEAFRANLEGKYYFGPDGKPIPITPHNLTDIKVGSTIKLRSPAWCNHGASGKPCATCFGLMSSRIPYNPYTKRLSVPGLFYGSVFGEHTSNATLKSKHRIDAASTTQFTVHPRDARYITTDGSYIYINPDFIDKEKDPYIILDKQTSADFADYVAMDDIDDLDVNHLAVKESIQFSTRVPNPMFEGKYGTELPVVCTEAGSRSARMTKDFIRYIKDSRMEEEGKLYKVSLLGWNPAVPAYELPIINEPLDAYRKRCEEFLKFTHLKGRIHDEVDEVFHGEQLVKFWKIVHEQNQDANIVIHEMLLWCCMVRDPIYLDMGLAGAEHRRYFMSYQSVILNGGQGTALLYGWQGLQLTGSPSNFAVKNKRRGPLESYLSPIARKAMRG